MVGVAVRAVQNQRPAVQLRLVDCGKRSNEHTTRPTVILAFTLKSSITGATRSN